MTTSALPVRALSKPLLIVAALAFMYSLVLAKLATDWWDDANYSHGLLIPIVIGFIVWQNLDRLRSYVAEPNAILGLGLMVCALSLLLAGTLASVLVAQRLSLVLMLAGVVVYFFGRRIIKALTVPFILILLAIPIPQIIFNKIAFPLQLLASRLADRGLRFFGLPVERKGNLIEIPFAGTGEIISLEVVEACSGIRSLMTLITLALLLGYLTRGKDAVADTGPTRQMSDRDILRTVLLMASAVPVALVTNAARVMTTGWLAYYFGRETIEGTWHDISGSVVFIGALCCLVVINLVLQRILGKPADETDASYLFARAEQRQTNVPFTKVAAVAVAVFICGLFVNWFQHRSEAVVERRPLSEIPARLGGWEQRNDDIRFDPDSEAVLRATDYVMRDYYGPGKRLNLYIGYYGSQRAGSTYHSPLSCLPGTGWEMIEPEILNISTPSGRQFSVNRYIIKQGEHKEYLIYWYQGRGRILSSEYVDKFYTSLDSVTRRRSDGGMVRIMTPLGRDPARSLAAAIDLTAHVADNLGEFLPD
jgi:exosortase D (VPLPA-CTERM-specific)